MLDSDVVTSIDLDEFVVVQAVDRLRELGCTPRITVAEARAGVPERGPFDRVIGTCGFTRVPTRVVGQLAEDSVLVLTPGCGLVVFRERPWLHGCPDLTRFGVSAHPDGSHDLWLDEPGLVVSALP